MKRHRPFVVLGLALFLLGCRRSPKPEAVPEPVEAGSPPAPAPVVFEDAGDAGTLTLPDGTVIALQPVGPGLITLGIAEKSAAWKTIEIERTIAGRGTQTETITRNAKYPPYTGHSSHVAAPGMTYVYRARADKGPWSAAANVRTGAPTHAPPPPSKVTATAKDRYSVEIRWEADVRAASGFKIEVKRDGTPTLATVARASDRAFVHNLLLPKQTGSYRIASFNEHGLSDFVESNLVTTPEKVDPPAKERPLNPCLPRKPNEPKSRFHGRLDHTADIAAGAIPLFTDERGQYMTERIMYAEYKGCWREMGRFDYQDPSFQKREWTDDGFPLLEVVMSAGMEYGSDVGTLGFSNNRYELLNTAHFCGPTRPGDPKDPTVPDQPDEHEILPWRGPFEVCQRDRK